MGASMTRNDSLLKMVDPLLFVDKDLLEEVWVVTIITKVCLDAKTTKWWSMNNILKTLEKPS